MASKHRSTLHILLAHKMNRASDLRRTCTGFDRTAYLGDSVNALAFIVRLAVFS